MPKTERRSYSIRRLREQVSKIIEEIELTDASFVITNNGRPVAEIGPYRAEHDDPMAALRGCVVRFERRS